MADALDARFRLTGRVVRLGAPRVVHLSMYDRNRAQAVQNTQTVLSALEQASARVKEAVSALIGLCDVGAARAAHTTTGGARALGLVGDALRLHRQQHTRLIADAFDRWLVTAAPTLLPSDPLTVAVRYDRTHRAALYRFIDAHCARERSELAQCPVLTDDDVPIDNSKTEREFQHVARLRLNMLFAGSSEGAHRTCVLLGLAATCRAQKVPLQAYLAWIFERLGTDRDTFNLTAAALTPAAYRRALWR